MEPPNPNATPGWPFNSDIQLGTDEGRTLLAAGSEGSIVMSLEARGAAPRNELRADVLGRTVSNADKLVCA